MLLRGESNRLNWDNEIGQTDGRGPDRATDLSEIRVMDRFGAGVTTDRSIKVGRTMWNTAALHTKSLNDYAYHTSLAFFSKAILNRLSSHIRTWDVAAGRIQHGYVRCYCASSRRQVREPRFIASPWKVSSTRKWRPNDLQFEYVGRRWRGSAVNGNIHALSFQPGASRRLSSGQTPG